MFAFPFLVYQGLYLPPSEVIPNYYGEEKSGERFVVNALLALCAFLQVLHSWWAYLITYILVKYARKGETKDLQEKVE